MIEFADPGYNWWFVWGALIGAAVLVGVVVILCLVDAVDLISLPTILIIFGSATVLLTSGADYSSHVDHLTVSALKDEGYDHVDLSGDRFTADLNGEYVQGALVRVDSGPGLYTYEIFHLKS